MIRRSLTTLAAPLLLQLVGCFSDGGGSGSAADESGGDGDGDGDADSEAGTAEGTGSSDASADTSGDGDGDGDGDACGMGQTCAPAVPAGWLGPVIIEQDDMGDAQCPVEFPSKVEGLHAGLIAPEAECGCDCGDQEGATCAAATLYEDDEGCNGMIFNPDSWQVPAGQCINISTSNTAFATVEGALLTGNAECPATPSEDIAQAAWMTDVASCEAAGADECGVDGVCVPEVDRSLCIYANGEAPECPDGAYEVPVLFHKSFVDDRSCTECSCAEPTGTCGGFINLSYQGCNGFFIDSINVPSNCYDIGSSVPQQAAYTAEIDASCEPVGGQAAGSAAVDEPVTFCCTA